MSPVTIPPPHAWTWLQQVWSVAAAALPRHGSPRQSQPAAGVFQWREKYFSCYLLTFMTFLRRHKERDELNCKTSGWAPLSARHRSQQHGTCQDLFQQNNRGFVGGCYCCGWLLVSAQDLR